MKTRLLALVFLISLHSFSQSLEKIDSLNVEICKSLGQNKNLKNEIRIQLVNENHLAPFFSKITDTVARREVFNKVFYRLQKNCVAFTEILNAEKENKSDWAIVKTEPEFKLSKTQCSDFAKIDRFTYKEYSGDIVNVTIENGFWIEKFNDATFSKLKFKKKGKCAFELEFVESNNETRKNFSKKGDKYMYQIYDAINGTYSAYTTKEDTYYTFKLYPVK